MSDKYYVGGDVTIFADNGKYKPISRVTLLVDDENSLTAGDDTGMEVIASCPHATHPMVNALLQTMKGYRYQAYEAGAANIDPAAELGDGVTVGGIYSPLSKLSDDGRGYAGISSPGEAEMEDEYPAEGYITQEFNRKISKTRSLITKTSEEITLKVEGIDAKYTVLKTTVDGVTITDQSGTTRIRGSSIETASIAANAIRADQVNLTGAISWADLDSNVRAEINDRGDDNPSYIKWSYIDSAKIVSPHIYGGDLYATGQGNAAGTNPAFYMSDGVTGSGANTEPNVPKGWLCFDKNGAGTAWEAAERVFLHSQPNVAIKIESGGNMSLDAAGFIHMQAPITLQSGVNYGTAAQRDAITPVNGRIFFVVE